MIESKVQKQQERVLKLQQIHAQLTKAIEESQINGDVKIAANHWKTYLRSLVDIANLFPGIVNFIRSPHMDGKDRLIIRLMVLQCNTCRSQLGAIQDLLNVSAVSVVRPKVAIFTTLTKGLLDETFNLLQEIIDDFPTDWNTIKAPPDALDLVTQAQSHGVDLTQNPGRLTRVVMAALTTGQSMQE